MRRHRNAERLLQTVDVVIPFVRHVGFPTHKPRTRRDFPRFLEVIEAVAFLRQMQKTRKVAVDPETGESLEYVEADQEDYKYRDDCAAAAIAHGLDDLPHHSRDLLDKIVVMVEKKIVPDDKERKQFTRKDITRFCHVTRKFLDDYLPPLQDGEFLEIVQGGRAGNTSINAPIA